MKQITEGKLNTFGKYWRKLFRKLEILGRIWDNVNKSRVKLKKITLNKMCVNFVHILSRFLIFPGIYSKI